MSNRVVRLARLFLSLAGLAAAGAAVLATQLGLDTNPDWGPSRKLLLLAGLGVAAGAWLPEAVARIGRAAAVGSSLDRAASALTALQKRLAAVPPVRGLVAGLGKAGAVLSNMAHTLPILRQITSTPRRTALSLCLLVWLGSVATFVWIGSVGTWRQWPATTADYDLLAQGLLHGEVSLAVQPSPQLLALPDPYAMQSRQFMPPMWDVSYFKGKFYLYWGPVPAVVAAIFRAATGMPIDDGMLTLVFGAGVSLLGLLCLLAMWDRWAGGLPVWTILPPAVALAWAPPLVWLFSRAAIYEAAIAAGQCFFLAGLLVLIPSLFGKPLSLGRLAAGAALLTLAIGSRLNLAPACLALVTLAVVETTLQTPSTGRRVAVVGTAAAPIGVGAALLGAYNYLRFGNFLEFGHRYQLGRWDKFHHYDSVFGLLNAVPNLYNYLLNGFHTLSVFPYLKPTWGVYYVWLTHTYAPPLYHTEKITGVLLAIPFAWVSGLAAACWLARAARSKPPSGLRSWLVSFLTGRAGPEVYLLGIAALLLAPLAFFVAVSMRHQVDFVPSLLLLAACGNWWLLSLLKTSRGLQGTLAVLAAGLGLATALIGVLLAITGFQGNFESLNPDLFRLLTKIFPG